MPRNFAGVAYPDGGKVQVINVTNTSGDGTVAHDGATRWTTT